MERQGEDERKRIKAERRRRLIEDEARRVRNEAIARLREKENLKKVEKELGEIWNIRDQNVEKKKAKRTTEHTITAGSNMHIIPEEILSNIFNLLIETSTSPGDYWNTRISCKEMNRLGRTPQILCKLRQPMLLPQPHHWDEGASVFLRRCSNEGNKEATFLLGMIYFYCLNQRYEGHRLIQMAATKGHVHSMFEYGMLNLYKRDNISKRSPKKGYEFVKAASEQGHLLANLEVAHCLSVGAGVQMNQQNVNEILESTEKFTKDNEPKIEEINLVISRWPRNLVKKCSFCSLPKLMDGDEFIECICGNLYCSYACKKMDWFVSHRRNCCGIP